MKIVIDIPDEIYNHTQKYEVGGFNIENDTKLFLAIKNGTPLPKGHGRLIDANKFLKDNEAYTGWVLNSSDWGGENAYKDALEDLVNEAPIIIEADKESD